MLLRLLLVVCVAVQAGAKEFLNLSDYLKKYVGDDETLQTEQIRLDSAGLQLRIAEDTFQSQLKLRPMFTGNYLEPTKELGAALTKINNERPLVRMDYLQSTPWGTSVALSATQFFSAGNGEIDYIDYENSITLEQDLWRNSFGSLLRSKKTLALAALDSQKKTFRTVSAKSCLEGSDVFLRSYLQQRRTAILYESLQLSNRALRSSEKAYRKRLLRRIDIVAARADSLAIKASFKNAESSRQKGLLELYRPLGEKVPQHVSVLRPKISFYKRNERVDLENNPRMKVGRAKVTEGEVNRDSVAADNKSDIKLGLELGARAGERFFNSNIKSEYDEQFMKVYFSMDWSVFNKTKDANRDIAENNLRAAKLGLRQVEQEESSKLEQMRVEFENLIVQIDSSSEKIKLFKEQVDEALQLLNNGRIEFADYQRTSDQFLAEKLHKAELENHLWSLNMQWAFTSGKLNQSCGGLL